MAISKDLLIEKKNFSNKTQNIFAETVSNPKPKLKKIPKIIITK